MAVRIASRGAAQLNAKSPATAPRVVGLTVPPAASARAWRRAWSSAVVIGERVSEPNAPARLKIIGTATPPDARPYERQPRQVDEAVVVPARRRARASGNRIVSSATAPLLT